MEPKVTQGPKSNENPPDANSSAPAECDAFSANYDAELAKGLRISGESKDYFAMGRMKHLRAKLDQRGIHPKAALDFGCGTGSATPFFFQILGVEIVKGLDPSESSLKEARKRWGDYEATFTTSASGWEESCDLAFCNGVFHHIPVKNRPEALAAVYASLRPGGSFAFWENNPWNPLTRLAMRLVPFDADAILVWPREARRILREGGFEVVSTDYVFFFPKFLAAFRFLEPCLSWLPLGGQYLVLSRKPECDTSDAN